MRAEDKYVALSLHLLDATLTMCRVLVLSEMLDPEDVLRTVDLSKLRSMCSSGEV